MLFGIAMRTKVLLSMDLPSLIWKPLAGQEPEEEDLRAVDASFVQLLDSMRDAKTQEVCSPCPFPPVLLLFSCDEPC